MPKRTTRKKKKKSVRSTKKVSGAKRLWLVCFQYDEPVTPGNRTPTGRFQVVVRASTPEKATGLCRERLKELRKTTDIFDEPCTIFLDHLVAIENVTTKAALVNLSSRMVFAEGGEGEILCGLPEQGDVNVDAYTPREEKGPVRPFLDFGGRRAAREHARPAAPPPLHA